MNNNSYQDEVERLLISAQTLTLSPLLPAKEFPAKELPAEELAAEDLVADKPEISLIPFLFDQRKLWIFVSRLSSHTRHLLAGAEVSVLIYQNDKPANNCFAIERVSALCKVTEQHNDRDAILDRMAEKLGDTIGLLRQLGDFHLFALEPQVGRYIAGFGQAYEVDFSNRSFEHINPAKNT